MFSAGVRRSLEARHFLNGDFGEESVPHSHPYEVEAVCYTGKLDSNGFSVDIALLEKLLESTLKGVDNILLNDLPWFSSIQPSLENLCLYIKDKIVSGFKEKGASLPEELEIRIWESDSAWASFRGKVY